MPHSIFEFQGKKKSNERTGYLFISKRCFLFFLFPFFSFWGHRTIHRLLFELICFVCFISVGYFIFFCFWLLGCSLFVVLSHRLLFESLFHFGWLFYFFCFLVCSLFSLCFFLLVFALFFFFLISVWSLMSTSIANAKIATKTPGALIS